MPTHFKKILVMRTDRLGDCLLNFPAIRALKETFKGKIFALVKNDLQDIVEKTPFIDAVIAYPENDNLAGIFRLSRRLSKEKFDLAVALNPDKKLHLLAFLAGIPKKLGYSRKWDFLLTDKIEDKKWQGQKHEIEYNLDLVRKIGADTQDKSLFFPVEKDDQDFIEALLKRLGVNKDEFLIAVQSQSSNPAKCWPASHFAKLCDSLADQDKANICFIGIESEKKNIDQIIAQMKNRAHNLCGYFNLTQLGAFLAKCRLLITNDSGPMHIASALKVPCLAIFGRNIPGVGPKRWGPWGNRHIVLHKDSGCRVCLDKNCPHDFKCLSMIKPEEVLRSAEEILLRAKS
jgi:heptosyltransferase-2